MLSDDRASRHVIGMRAVMPCWLPYRGWHCPECRCSHSVVASKPSRVADVCIGGWREGFRMKERAWETCSVWARALFLLLQTSMPLPEVFWSG